MDHQAMVRYLAGEARVPPDDADLALRAFGEYLNAHAGEGEIDLGRLVRWMVERTMLPRGRVERTVSAMLELAAKLDATLGPPEAEDRRGADAPGS